MILHNRYTQVQQAIASFQEQIAYLQQQVLEHQEHLQKLESLEAAAESAVTQVANAIKMARAIDPSQELVIKQALLELFELPVLPEYAPDTDSTPTVHHPDTSNTPSEQPLHGVDTTVEVRAEYAPDTDSTPTVHHPDTESTTSEQTPHGVDTLTTRLTDMTVSELKTLLGKHQLPKNGNKPTLIQRIINSIDPWDLESLL